MQVECKKALPKEVMMCQQMNSLQAAGIAGSKINLRLTAT